MSVYVKVSVEIGNGEDTPVVRAMTTACQSEDLSFDGVLAIVRAQAPVVGQQAIASFSRQVVLSELGLDEEI